MVSLPIIDLRSYPSIESLANALLQVGKDPGFFYLTGHDLEPYKVQSTFHVVESFFLDTTQEEKQRYHNSSGGMGYTGLGDEKWVSSN
jgi:isopenicillin N synthase-like dioxygenase